MSKLKEQAVRILLSAGLATISLAFYQNCAEEIDLSSYNEASEEEFDHPCGTTEAEISACLAAAGKAPRITQIPLPKTLSFGAALNIAVTAAGDGLTYEWYKDGVRQVQFASNTFSVPAVNLSHTGSYTVVVKNGLGQDTGKVDVSVSCAGATHAEGVNCVSNTRSCGNGTQTWNGSAFGTCVCDSGFTLNGATCIQTTGTWVQLPFGSTNACGNTLAFGATSPKAGAVCSPLGHVTCVPSLVTIKFKCQ